MKYDGYNNDVNEEWFDYLAIFLTLCLMFIVLFFTMY